MGSDYMPVPFDSRKIYYRSPFGAVEQGTEIHFRILLPKAEHTQKAQLCVKYDYDCNWEFTELIWCGKFDEDTEIWECDFTPKKIGLYWYNFKLTTIDKTRYVIPSDPYKVSTIEDYMGRSWQITCYKKGFKTPGWLVGGIMYQIFPDRFYFSGEEKNIKRTDYKRNKDWYALPEWKPDENGMIKNNDFFMGDLKGITMKLDYLESLGVSCITLILSAKHTQTTAMIRATTQRLIRFSERRKILSTFAQRLKRGEYTSSMTVCSLIREVTAFTSTVTADTARAVRIMTKTRRISVGTNSTNGRTITKAGGALILCPRLLRKLRHSTNISTAKTALSENG